jgi:hypothetical protein
VELRARAPRYQKEMLQWLARRNQTSVDDVLTRESEDVVSAYAEEIASDVAGFEMAMSWLEPAASAATRGQLEHTPSETAGTLLPVD